MVNTDQKSAQIFFFINHKTLPMFISGQMIGFCMQKGKLNWKFFPPLFALNYLQIIICKPFANKNYLQISLPSIYGRLLGKERYKQYELN